MTKRKTKKRRFDTLFDFFQHPLSTFDHLTIVRLTLIFCGLIWVTGAASAFEPRETAQSSNGSHARVFVIFATVFSDQGFALPGARARVRRTDEKKYRWEGMSDHQGEVAFRVPPGGEYELIIEARGFKPEIRKINAREENQSDLTIRMAALTAPETVPHKTDTGTGGKP
jgi:hypothetical protein